MLRSELTVAQTDMEQVLYYLLSTKKIPLNHYVHTDAKINPP
jgi:hypothetical protein